MYASAHLKNSENFTTPAHSPGLIAVFCFPANVTGELSIMLDRECAQRTGDIPGKQKTAISPGEWAGVVKFSEFFKCALAYIAEINVALR